MTQSQVASHLAEKVGIYSRAYPAAFHGGQGPEGLGARGEVAFERRKTTVTSARAFTVESWRDDGSVATS